MKLIISNRISSITLVAALLCAGTISCKKTDNSAKPDDPDPKGASIYICGTDYDNNGLGNIGVYWKNNQRELIATASSGYLDIASIAVSDGGDVYVAGSKTNIVTGKTEALYWKNGNPTSLTNGSNDARATSVYVSGNDVYIAGTDGNNAVYWKNGTPVILSSNGGTSSVFVSGGDIYVAGRDGNDAVYWKNGTKVNIGNGSYSQSIFSIYVYGGDVYTAGQRRYLNATNTRQVATYWKNGIAVEVGSGINHSVANSIYVSDIGDVYIAGWEENGTGGNSVGRYWKNGVPVSLASNAVGSSANSICISSGDVYVAGWKKNTNGVGTPMAAYWKNGEEIMLSNNQSIATGIVVK